MRALWCVLLLFLLVPAWAAEPDVRLQARLSPPQNVMVGGIVELQIDLLVDTWFSAAPRLPALELAGAVVTPPTGEAEHLNEQIEGKTFYGMRYRYSITPQQAQWFSIPGLEFGVEAGQSSGLVTLHSPALSFNAQFPPGFSGEAHVLVATGVDYSQSIVKSHTPLRVGDTVTRQLTLRADNAQALLMPAPDTVDVDGLRRYSQAPKVQALDDGRGSSIGAQRVDALSYVVEQPGRYQLPALELAWWDAAAGVKRVASLPAVEFEASAASTYQAPFSISEDLKSLGQQSHLTISRHWLLLSLLLVGLTFAAPFIKPYLMLWLKTLRQWCQTRRAARLGSAGFALRQVRRELAAKPMMLSGLYLWVRRSSGDISLAAFARQRSADSTRRLFTLLQSLYGKAPSEPPKPAAILATLHQSAGRKRRVICSASRLVPLHPNQFDQAQ